MSLALAIFALRLAAAAPDAVTPPASSPPSPESAAPSSAPPPSDGTGTISDAYVAAESRQGPLDGTWRLDEAGGGLLYLLQINDPGQGDAPDGAWRDPRRAGATDSSGFLGAIRRGGDTLEIHLGTGLFSPVVTLKPSPNGGWSGELSRDGPRRKVILSRY